MGRRRGCFCRWAIGWRGDRFLGLGRGSRIEIGGTRIRGGRGEGLGELGLGGELVAVGDEVAEAVDELAEVGADFGVAEEVVEVGGEFLGVLKGGAGRFEGLLEEEERGWVGEVGAGSAEVGAGDGGVGAEGF